MHICTGLDQNKLRVRSTRILQIKNLTMQNYTACNCTWTLLADRLLAEAMDTDPLMFAVFGVAHRCTGGIAL